MTIIAIDPGFRDCGVAVFRDGTLVRCDHVKSKATGLVEAIQFSQTADAVMEFVSDVVEDGHFDLAIEYPQQYANSPAPRESVQKLVGVIGALAARVQATSCGLSVRVTTYKPREWKGQVPKEIMFDRILSRLNEDENETLPALSKTRLSHVYDAIGIGLHHLGRLKNVAANAETLPSGLG